MDKQTLHKYKHNLQLFSTIVTVENRPAPAVGPVMSSICSKNVSGSSAMESDAAETGIDVNKGNPGSKIIVVPEISPNSDAVAEDTGR